MKGENKTPTFLTIRETARLGIISEHYLRLLQKEGKLPGIKTGNTFRVNYEMLIDFLNQESVPSVSAENN